MMTMFGGACSKGCSWPFYVQWCMGQMNKGNWDFDGGKKKKKKINPFKCIQFWAWLPFFSFW